MERQEGRPIIQTSTSATSDTPLPIPANFKVSTSVDAEIPAVAESYPNGSKDICLLKKPVKNYKSTDNLIGGAYYLFLPLLFQFEIFSSLEAAYSCDVMRL